jgi:hypothetical protein
MVECDKGEYARVPNTLRAKNKDLPTFRLSSLPHLLEQCGAYFTCVSQGARWYTIFDERMSTHHHMNDKDETETVIDKNYPAILCGCGFEVTAEEAHVLARIARNYAAIQRTLPDPTEEEKNAPITVPRYMLPFPQKIRSDWVEQYERFAEWAEQSDGFTV